MHITKLLALGKDLLARLYLYLKVYIYGNFYGNVYGKSHTLHETNLFVFLILVICIL